MITRRSVFKKPLCPNCTHFERTVLQDDQVVVHCDVYQTLVQLTPNNLASECTMFSDLLKDKYWEQFEKADREIPIIGTKRLAQAGFKPETQSE